MTRDICSTHPSDDASVRLSNVVSLDEYRARKYGACAESDNNLQRLADECAASIKRLEGVESLRGAANVCREIASEIRSERQARLNTLRSIEANVDALLAKY